jgi:hypothetical protein
VAPLINPRMKRLRKLIMEKNPLTKGILTENFTGIGTVTREMVLKRARELALINGHSPDHVSKSEFAQARRELTGGLDISPKEEAVESVSESERWEPLPGSTGHKAPESSDEDEDSEGRSESAQLVEEGVNEAEHDQMLQAAKVATKKDNQGR